VTDALCPCKFSWLSPQAAENKQVLVVDWLLACVSAGFIDVRAVPAIRAAAEGGSKQVASWLVPLWLLCVAFIVTAAWEARRHTSHYEGTRHWIPVSTRYATSPDTLKLCCYCRSINTRGFAGCCCWSDYLWMEAYKHPVGVAAVQVLASSGDCMLGFITAALMLTAVVTLSVYCSQTALAVRPKPSYNMYDDITLSQAHIMLPAKASPNITDPAEVSRLLAAATAAGKGDVNKVLRYGRLPERPGDAGRWLLADADGDWDEWAGLMGGVHRMADLWAAYTLLQGIILVLLIFRWGVLEQQFAKCLLTWHSLVVETLR